MYTALQKPRIGSLESQQAEAHNTSHVRQSVRAIQGNQTINENGAIIEAKVAGVTVEFLIDSGAHVNTLTKAKFDEILTNTRAASKVLALTYSTDKPLKAYATDGHIKVIANFFAELYISEDRPIMVEKFYVLNEQKALLGFNTAIRYSVLDIGLDVPVRHHRLLSAQGDANSINCAQQVAISDQFPKFNIPAVSLKYDKEMPPARNVYTHIPAAFKEATRQKLQDLLSSGIIEEVTSDMDRSFCSSLLVVPKGKEDIRLVIDLRGPNRCIYRTPFKMPTFESIIMELHGAQWFSTIDLTIPSH